MEISPSGVAPVCQAGDQLELTCIVSGAFLRWQFTVIREDGTVPTFISDISSGGTTDVFLPRMPNSTSFTFSRLSTQPLMSRMTITPVSEGLNGVQVSCIDRVTSESATTTIRIIDARPGGRKLATLHSLMPKVGNLIFPWAYWTLWTFTVYIMGRGWGWCYMGIG